MSIKKSNVDHFSETESNEIALQNRLALAEAQALLRHVPKLADLGISPTLETAVPVLEFLQSVLPVFYPPSIEAYLRTQLSILKTATTDKVVHADIDFAMAESAMRSGMPDSRHARTCATDLRIAKEWQAQIEMLEAAYEALFITKAWPDATRDQSLIHLFERKPIQLASLRILHIAPETEFEAWIRARLACATGNDSFTYETLDGYRGGVDIPADLTDTELPSNAYDLVICHRVMEHIVDDQAAFAEVFRILAPGGLFQMSVPQACHLSTTVDWLYPDATHHGHVRHYAADLNLRLERSGFNVRIEDWLLHQPDEELLAIKAYPMRIIEGIKPI